LQRIPVLERSTCEEPCSHDIILFTQAVLVVLVVFIVFIVLAVFIVLIVLALCSLCSHCAHCTHCARIVLIVLVVLIVQNACQHFNSCQIRFVSSYFETLRMCQTSFVCSVHREAPLPGHQPQRQSTKTRRKTPSLLSNHFKANLIS
jgi:uncharacterized integral membrane protein